MARSSSHAVCKLLKNSYLKNSFDSLEIGTHHEKFFLDLENITPKENIDFVIDVFENQQNNFDRFKK